MNNSRLLTDLARARAQFQLEALMKAMGVKQSDIVRLDNSHNGWEMKTKIERKATKQEILDWIEEQKAQTYDGYIRVLLDYDFRDVGGLPWLGRIDHSEAEMIMPSGMSEKQAYQLKLDNSRKDGA